MAYYDALIAQWSILTGTTDQKLTAINAMTVAGPNVDVDVASIVGVLLLGGAYVSFAAFAAGSVNGNPSHDAALVSAKTLMAFVTVPNAPNVQMSQPTVYAKVNAMGSAILAWETANPGATGFTQAIHDSLMALASTTITWWQANGYTSPFNMVDINAAGLT